VPQIPTHYLKHLENALDKLNETEGEFTGSVIQEFAGKGTVTFSPCAQTPAPAAPDVDVDADTAGQSANSGGRPDRVSGGSRQNRQPA
jgi:hypothetical protein